MNQFQSVDEVMAALRRRAYLIVPIFLLGCVLSMYFAANMIKMYEATAVVQIEEARIPEAMSGAAAEGVRDLEALEAVAALGLLADNLERAERAAVAERRRRAKEAKKRDMSTALEQ